MKQQFTGTYTFTPSTGVVTLNGIDLPLERLYLIVNTTRNTPIFNFAVSGLGAARTFGSGNTSFDVAFNTSSHSSTDRLAIIYDDGVLEGAATQPVSVSQTVSIFGEKFKTLANWSWSVSDHSPVLGLAGLEGRILRIRGEWNGNGAPKTYRVTRVAAPNTNIVNQQVQAWSTGVVIPAGTGTEGGDFYYRVPSELNAHGQLQLLKVSGDNIGAATATIFLYEESDLLDQGYSVVLSKPLTDEQLRAAAVPVSGTITAQAYSGGLQTIEGELTGSSSTQVLPAIISRRYLFIQNLSSAPIYLNFTPAIGSAPATPNSMRLDAGASLSFEGNFVPNSAVNLLRSATINQRYFLMHASY